MRNIQEFELGTASYGFIVPQIQRCKIIATLIAPKIEANLASISDCKNQVIFSIPTNLLEVINHENFAL